MGEPAFNDWRLVSLTPLPAWAVGLVAIFWGVVFIATGLAARRELREWRAAEDSDDVSGAPEGHVRATPSEADIPSQPRGEAAARQEAPGTSA